MKNFTASLVFAMTLCLIMAFTTITKSFEARVPITLEPKELIISYPEIKVELVDINFKGHEEFLDAIGFRESGNRYDIVNKYGYMGKYQFGKSTLKGLGFKVTREEFIQSPLLQEKAMHKLLLHNRKKLHKFIEEYDGKVVNGVVITESGVLAAAHLAGAGNVRRFFNHGKDFKDGFGTTLTSYLREFKGYNLDL